MQRTTDIQTSQMVLPSEMRVLMNHIYEYKKGVRRMILFTCNRRFEQQACHRLGRQSIDYVVQPAGKENVKVAFKYVSTTAVAPTWEVKTVTIK